MENLFNLLIDEIITTESLYYYNDPNSIDEDALSDYCAEHNIDFIMVKNELENRGVNLI